LSATSAQPGIFLICKRAAPATNSHIFRGQNAFLVHELTFLVETPSSQTLKACKMPLVSLYETVLFNFYRPPPSGNTKTCKCVLFIFYSMNWILDTRNSFLLYSLKSLSRKKSKDKRSDPVPRLEQITNVDSASSNSLTLVLDVKRETVVSRKCTHLNAIFQQCPFHIHRDPSAPPLM